VEIMFRPLTYGKGNICLSVMQFEIMWAVFSSGLN
jgi:hypothetical protein